MLLSIRSRFTYANIVASLALFVALGGGAYAAIKLPAGSVGPKQLQRNAVRSAEVRNSSLLGVDFKPGELRSGHKGTQGARGPQGPIGPKGDTGPQGPPGTDGTDGATDFEVRTAGPSATNPSFSLAACEDHSPEHATGGGGGGGTIIQSAPWIADHHNGNRPAAAGEAPNAWGVTVASGSATSYVVCAS